MNLRVEGYGTLQGDVAWGGNWFFVVKQSPLPLERKRIRELTELSLGIRTALEEEGLLEKVVHLSIISSCAVHPPPKLPMGKISCFAQAAPLTVRLAVPGPVQN